MYCSQTIVPIPPSYENDGALELSSTIDYLNYLGRNGIRTVMTTVGTSQFNLLTHEEVHRLNSVVAQSDIQFKILGIPPLSLAAAKEFIVRTEDYCDVNCYLMVLYPDRYYDDDTLVKYLDALRTVSNNALYAHCMAMRAGTGGIWNYTPEVINRLSDMGVIQGIKEEHPSLAAAYDFVATLKSEVDVIVAGGSMRRHQFLRTAGANSFLAGLGNIFPGIELEYLEALQQNRDIQNHLSIESLFFATFMKYGWHKSLREALRQEGLTCKNNRSPWPLTKDTEAQEISDVIGKIKRLASEQQ